MGWIDLAARDGYDRQQFLGSKHVKYLLYKQLISHDIRQENRGNEYSSIGTAKANRKTKRINQVTNQRINQSTNPLISQPIFSQIDFR